VLRYLAVAANIFYLNVFPLEESHNGLKCQDRRRQVAFMRQYRVAGIKNWWYVYRSLKTSDKAHCDLNGLPRFVIQYIYIDLPFRSWSRSKAAGAVAVAAVIKVGKGINSFNWYIEGLLHKIRSQDSSLSVVTTLRAGRPGESGCDPGRRRVLCFFIASRPTVGPTERYSVECTRTVAPGVERPEA
jgi:hypothetical protein